MNTLHYVHKCTTVNNTRTRTHAGTTLLHKEVDMLKDHQPSVRGNWLAGEMPTERSLVSQTGQAEKCLYSKVNSQHNQR